MAKLYSSQVAERVASKCIELLGGVGFTMALFIAGLAFSSQADLDAFFAGTIEAFLGSSVT